MAVRGAQKKVELMTEEDSVPISEGFAAVRADITQLGKDLVRQGKDLSRQVEQSEAKVLGAVSALDQKLAKQFAALAKLVKK